MATELGKLDRLTRARFGSTRLKTSRPGSLRMPTGFPRHLGSTSSWRQPNTRSAATPEDVLQAQRFWRLLHAAGFTSRLYEPAEQYAVLDEGIGITNAAYRTTPGSGDLRRADFACAAERLERLAAELTPGWLAFQPR